VLSGLFRWLARLSCSLKAILEPTGEGAGYRALRVQCTEPLRLVAALGVGRDDDRALREVQGQHASHAAVHGGIRHAAIGRDLGELLVDVLKELPSTGVTELESVPPVGWPRADEDVYRGPLTAVLGVAT